LHRIIPLQVIETLLFQGAMFEDDQLPENDMIDAYLSKIRQKSVLFADLSLECSELLELKLYPTQIALACLIASRTVNEIRPAWNSKFRHILNYT